MPRKPGPAHAYYLAHKDDQTDNCMIWPHATVGGLAREGGGYGYITINQKQILVHNLTCEAVWGPRPTPSHQAAHGPCHNRQCWNPRHLSWKLPVENTRDRVRDGTNAQGELLPQAKLTAAVADAIRTAYAADSSHGRISALARENGVHPDTISRLLGRTRAPQTWRHIL